MPAADIGNPRKLKKPLYGAVLAVLPVKNGKDNVYMNFAYAVFPENKQSVFGGVGGKSRFGYISVDP